MSSYFEELDNTGNSLMIYKDGRLIFQSASKGIRPHLEAIEDHGEALRGTLMVDKIVGRAAALLILYSEAAEVHAQVLSRPGKQVLDQHGLTTTYEELVDHIKMRDGSIYCPFERMVQDVSDPAEAYAAIVEKMNSFNAQPSS
ncbi:MAG TPA: DUF1893 domain-containing protein [Candidatus Krumholzibacteriaceae bacterium]|nr:DUF1893 domain-containing protein [Candidatus Krumholzibacteriaceae bacterium]